MGYPALQEARYRGSQVSEQSLGHFLLSVICFRVAFSVGLGWGQSPATTFLAAPDVSVIGVAEAKKQQKHGGGWDGGGAAMSHLPKTSLAPVSLPGPMVVDSELEAF
jgi:hypothetical protein